MKKTLKGFTLIELGIVIFSLSILTSIIVPNLQRYIEEAEIATDVANAKIVYEACMLTVSTDDDVYRSAFNQGGSNPGVYKEKIDPVTGEVIGYERVSHGKTVTGSDGSSINVGDNRAMVIVTRCDGVDGAQRKAYEAQDKNGKTYDFHGLGECIYTWENVTDSGSLSNKGDLIRKNTNGHQRFTVALCENMNMPIMGDEYEGGTYTAKRTSGTKVHKDRTYLRMRYIRHKMAPTSGNKGSNGQTYDPRNAYRWFVTYDVNDLSFHIVSGTGQGAEAGVKDGAYGLEGFYEIYPNSSAEYDITNGSNTATLK